MPVERTITLKEWRAKYESYLCKVNRSETARRYGIALENFFSRFKDRRYPHDVFATDMEDYKCARLGEKVHPQTINFEISTVRSFYNWLINIHELPTFNPAARIKRLRVPENPRRAVSKEQIGAIIAAAEGPRENMLVRLAFGTGMRIGEMSALMWSWIDLKEGSIFLPGDEVKNFRGRVVPLRPDLLEVLRFNAPADGKDSSVLAWAKPTIELHWREICERAGVKGVKPHRARHTFATYMLRAGADIETVRDLLGHRSINTTARYLCPADAIETRKLIASLPL